MRAADLFSKVFQLIPAGAAITRLTDGVIADVNEGFERILGYTRADVIGRTASELNLYAEPDDQTDIARLVREQRFVDGHEVKGRDKAGTIRDLLLSAQGIDLNGQPCLLLTFHDITARKRMEAMVRDSEERYRALTQSAKDAIVSADQNGRIISWNSGAQTTFGYAADEVISRPLTVLMPERYHVLHSEGGFALLP